MCVCVCVCVCVCMCVLVGLLCLTSHRQRGHLETAPHLLCLAKDVKLDKYTVRNGI